MRRASGWRARLLVPVLMVLVLIAGCASPQQPSPPPSVEPEEVEEGERAPVLQIPVLAHPPQLVFRSDTGGVMEVNSSGEVLVLRGPHSAPFSIRVEDGRVRVRGAGSGKVILGARQGEVVYFSRAWVTGIRSPSFAVLPAEGVVFLRYGEEVELPVRVVPIGDFRGEVRLSAKSSTPAVVAQLKASGVPPFNATMRVLAKGLVGDGHHIRIVGVSGEERAESYVRINNPVRRREGLLASLLRLVWLAMFPVTFTLSIALGAITGAAAGAVSLTALVASPVMFFSPDFVELIGTGPEAGRAVTKEVLELHSGSPFSGAAVDGGRVTGLSTIAVSNSSFRVLLPRVELTPAVGQEVELPLYVAGSGYVRMNVSAPPGVEARVTPERGEAPFEAVLRVLPLREAPKRGLIFKRKGEYVVTLRATSGGVQEEYRVYLRPQRRDYEVRLSSEVVYMEPGGYAAVSALVLRNSRFAPEEHTLRVAAPPGFEVLASPDSGRTPFLANVTVHAGEVEPGRYTVSVGSAKLEVLVGRGGDAVVAPPGVSVAQGSAASFEVKVYTLGEEVRPLEVRLPLNHSVRGEGYSYYVEVVADRYTPPGEYTGRVAYGKVELPLKLTVTGSPVVLEHPGTLRVGRGESSTVELRLASAGYRGRVVLNATATGGIVVEPSSITAEVPGRVRVRISNPSGEYGSVSFSGVVEYRGMPYTVSGALQVVP